MKTIYSDGEHDDSEGLAAWMAGEDVWHQRLGKNIKLAELPSGAYLDLQGVTLIPFEKKPYKHWNPGVGVRFDRTRQDASGYRDALKRAEAVTE